MPNPDMKLKNTILYMLKRSAAHRPPLTVLLKMLWYADYAHYSEFLTSITGARYVAMKRGPVVDGYKALFDQMEQAGMLTQEKVVSARFPESPTQYYSAAVMYDAAVFEESEIDMMEAVIAACAHKTGKDLSDSTHGRGEPWTLVWDEDRSTPAKPIPEVLWRWSENLPDETDLVLAREDVGRGHVKASLAKLRSEERPLTPA